MKKILVLLALFFPLLVAAQNSETIMIRHHPSGGGSSCCTVVQKNLYNNGSGSSVAKQFGSNTTTGNDVFAQILYSGSGLTISGCTYGATSMTVLACSPAQFSSNYSCLAYLHNITGAATPTITCNFSGSTAANSISILEVNGVTTGLDTSSSNAATTLAGCSLTYTNVGCTTGQTQITTSHTKEFILSGVLCGGGCTGGAGTGYTLDNQTNFYYYSADQYKITSSSGTYVDMWATTSGGDWADIIASFY